MRKGLVILLVLVIILVGIPVYMWITSYNKIVTQDEQIAISWAQVETVLQCRYDLIPNLVDTVKGYATQAKELFEEITRLQSQWTGTQNRDERIKTASALESALRCLMAIVENYPKLKTSRNFLALQNEFAATENRLSAGQRRYNEVVRQYNSIVRRFPGNVIVRIHGYAKNTAYFEAAQPAK